MADLSNSDRSRRRSASSRRSSQASRSSRSTSQSSTPQTSKGEKRHSSKRKPKQKLVMSLETIIYVVHLIFFFFYVVPKFGGTVKTKCEGYLGCSRFIRPTVWGYRIDLADGQWRDMRGNFLLLWGTLVLTTAGHWICSKVWNLRKPKSPIGEMATVSAIFRLGVGIIFLYVLHGRHSLIVWLLAYLGYRITNWQLEAGSTSRVYSWGFAIFVILFKESYRLKHLPWLSFLRPVFDHDQYGGMYRWQLPANFLILRILSFSLDFIGATEDENGMMSLKQSRSSKVTRSRSRSRSRGAKTSQAVAAPAPAAADAMVGRIVGSGSDPDDDGAPEEIGSNYGGDGSCHSGEWEASSSPTDPVRRDADGRERARLQSRLSTELTKENLSNASRPLTDYNIINYLSYIFYTPLYTAGPIITFNAFVENTHHPQKSEDPYRYAGRWLLCMLCMEFLSSKFPFFAVIQSGLFPYLSPAEMAITAYFALKMMWLKFLITWRFFRLWAMADGTLAPENMLRCMSNNCSLEQFWRGWHASFNKWIVRYMYKPMGGRESRMYSVWLIFLFVAAWHDLELKLVVWGLLNGVFYVVEVLAKRGLKSTMMRTLPASLVQAIVVLSGATYILVLVGVNLTGYAIGVSGLQAVLNKFVTWEGFTTLVGTYYFLCLAVSFMNFLQRMGWTNSGTSADSYVDDRGGKSKQSKR